MSETCTDTAQDRDDVEEEVALAASRDNAEISHANESLKELGITEEDVKPKSLDEFVDESAGDQDLARMRFESNEVDRRALLRTLRSKQTFKSPSRPKRSAVAPSSAKNRLKRRQERELRQLLAWELGELQLAARAKALAEEAKLVEKKVEAKQLREKRELEDLRVQRETEAQQHKKRWLEQERLKRSVQETKLERAMLIEEHKRMVAEVQAAEREKIRKMQRQEQERRIAVAQERQRALADAKRAVQMRKDAERDAKIKEKQDLRARKLEEKRLAHAEKTKKAHEMHVRRQAVAQAELEQKKRAVELLRITEERKAEVLRKMKAAERSERLEEAAGVLAERSERAKNAMQSSIKEIEEQKRAEVSARLQAKEALIEHAQIIKKQQLEEKRAKMRAHAHLARQKAAKQRDKENQKRERLAAKLRLEDERLEAQRREKNAELQKKRKALSAYERRRRTVKAEFADLRAQAVTKGIDYRGVAAAIRGPLEKEGSYSGASESSMISSLHSTPRSRKGRLGPGAPTTTSSSSDVSTLRQKLEKSLRQELEADRALQLDILAAISSQDEENEEGTSSNASERRAELEKKLAEQRKVASERILQLAHEYDAAVAQ
jgi:hypothetical protein